MEPAARKALPRSRRLLRHADFQRVYQQGQRHFATHMTVFYWFRAGADAPRIGFTVTRALGGAVVRNRIRRRLREAVRLLRLDERLRADIVVNPKKSLLTAGFTDIQQEVRRAFEIIARRCEARAGSGESGTQ
jgi:ribonuclease P protein component